MLGNGAVGAKRPHADKENLPRKRPQVDADEDFIEEDFDLEPPEDDLDEKAAVLEVEDALGEAGKNWERPAPPPLDPSKDRLVFQQLEVDYTSGPPNKQHYKTELQEVPILRMFGVTEKGEKAAALAGREVQQLLLCRP